MSSYHWVMNRQHTHGGVILWDLLDSHAGERMVAWIESRPHYCDRGHWKGMVELPDVDLDHQDGFPRYYMLLERAQAEIMDFVNWRLHRIRAE